MRALLLLLALTTTAQAQWTLLQSPTTADLRGIDNAGHGILWASGTNGTVLRSEDAGYLWQRCTIPPGSEHLDFRGIQAFDANTAIVMSSGKGDQSRLYKTTDGCQTWTLLFTNPDKDGFWDALVLDNTQVPRNKPAALLVGDPVNGKFPIWGVVLGAEVPFVYPFPYRPRAHKSESIFAASNSSIFVHGGYWIATGGEGGARVIREVSHGADELSWTTLPSSPVPVGSHTSSSGIFSIGFAEAPNPPPHDWEIHLSNYGVAVGGDYLKPNDSTRTAAFTTNGGKTWHAAATPPHGYRSAVAYDAPTKTWITIGPNGTDISTDDGRNWHALRPDPKSNEPPDADQHWNALSLPYAVGPHGRIGRLNPTALKPTPPKP
ncbi:MAG: hypothetical protein WBY53_01715 [Acidobacteriaceae bacterium]